MRVVLTTSLICGRGRGGEARDAEGEWEHGGDHGAADSGGEHRRVEERGAGRLGRCLRVLGAAGRRAGAAVRTVEQGRCRGRWGGRVGFQGERETRGGVGRGQWREGSRGRERGWRQRGQGRARERRGGVGGGEMVSRTVGSRAAWRQEPLLPVQCKWRQNSAKLACSRAVPRLGGELRSEGEHRGAREWRTDAKINELIHALLRFGKNRGGCMPPVRQNV